MKVTVQSDFLCSYFYHAAKNASEEIPKHKLPNSLYHALTSLLLWQCVFESYANFQIRRHKLEGFQVRRRSGVTLSLEDASIKEKWIYLPVAINKKHFTLNKTPFTDFARLVDLRNALIHFDQEAMSFEKEAPSGIVSIGDLKAWMGTGDYLSGSIFDSIVRYGIAGKVIVTDMFREYCRLTEDATPSFLIGSESVLTVKIGK